MTMMVITILMTDDKMVLTAGKGDGEEKRGGEDPEVWLQCWYDSWILDMTIILNLALTRYGCPKKMAEQKFYETIAAIKKEREEKAVEEKKIEDKFDPK